MRKESQTLSITQPKYASLQRTLEELIAAGKLEEAYTHSHRAYWQKVADRCIYKLTGLVNNPEADGEAIAQQAFNEFYNVLIESRYNSSKATVQNFISHIANMRLIDKLRTPNRNIPGRDVDLDELDSRGFKGNYTSDIEQRLLEEEDETLKRERLDRGLAKLNNSDRQILEWRYKQGHSVAKIAEFTGEKEGTIRTRIHRALVKLRKACNGDR